MEGNRPLSALLHQAIAIGDTEKVQELLKEGACANRPVSISEHIVERVRRSSKGNSIASRLSTTSNLEPISESTPSKPLVTTTSMDRKSLDLTTEDFVTTDTMTTDDALVNEVETIGIDDVSKADENHVNNDIENESGEENQKANEIQNEKDIVDEKQNENENDIANECENKNEIFDTEKEAESIVQNEDEIKQESEKREEENDPELVHLTTTDDQSNEEASPDVQQGDYIELAAKTTVNENHDEGKALDEDDIEQIMADLEPLQEGDDDVMNGENNNRKSVANVIDEKLNDDNETLIERQPSISVRPDANDETDVKSPLKIIPRIKRKLSMKWRSRNKTKEKDFDEEETDFEEFYENVPKVKNVDDEQLAENFAGVAFFEAVRDGMDMIVQTLLETSNNYQLDLPDENGFTPAMQASWHGQTDCLQILLEHGADIRQQNTAGCTAAHFAAGQGNTECLRLLVEYSEDDIEEGSIVDVKTKFGATPLILAARGGYTECVDLLLEHGADPNTQYRGNQNSLLFAAGNGHYDCLEKLLECDVDTDQGNSQGVTPLMRAVQQGHNTCVVLLLDKDAETDLQDSIGRTAVHFAVENKNPKALKLLLEAGARIDLKSKGGSTAMAYAERFQSIRCLELLENKLAEIREKEIQDEMLRKQSEQNNKHEVVIKRTKEKQQTCGVFKNIFRRKKRTTSDVFE